MVAYVCSVSRDIGYSSFLTGASQNGANGANDTELFGTAWINKVIEFEAANILSAKKWKIVSKLTEDYVQEDEEGWEEFEREPMPAWALFECVNPVDASASAFMKIYMQYVHTS